MGIKKLRVSFKSSFWENKIQKDVGLLKVLTEKSVGDFSNLFKIPKTKFKSRCFCLNSEHLHSIIFRQINRDTPRFRSELFSSDIGPGPKTRDILENDFVVGFFSPPSPGRMPRDQFGAKPRRHDYAAPLETLPNTQLNDSSW